MYKSFEEGLFERRSRLQQKIRKKDIQRRLVEKREERLAVLDEAKHLKMIEGLPHTIPEIGNGVLDSNGRQLKEMLVDRIDRLKACITVSSVNTNMLCFILADLIVSLPQRLALIIEETLLGILLRVHQQLLSGSLENTTPIIKLLAIVLDCYPIDSLGIQQYEAICRLLQSILAGVKLDDSVAQELIQLMSAILNEDCEGTHPSAKLTRKYQLINVCFVQHPKLLKELFYLYFAYQDEEVVKNPDATELLEVTLMQMMLNLTYYIAPEQEHCIESYQIYCLLKRALWEERKPVIMMGVQIFYNFLFFDREKMQDLNDFGFVNRLLMLLKESSGESGFDFISEVLNSLSQYIIVINPTTQSHLMNTFLAREGLDAMLWELNNRDLHEYNTAATLGCLYAIQKLTVYITSSYLSEYCKVLFAHQPYLLKLSESEDKKISKAAEEIKNNLSQYFAEERDTID